MSKQPWPLIFLGTTDFSVECLTNLIESPDYKVVGVITKEDAFRSRRGLKVMGTPVKIFCQKQNIPFKSLKDLSRARECFSPLATLAVVVAYGRILPSSFLSSFPKGGVNIHPSLLPKWRGAAPVERALMAGDRKTGVSLQTLSKELDAGDIIGKYEFPINEEDTALEVYQKVKKISKDLLLKDLLFFLQGKIVPEPQKINTQPLVYAHKIQKKECEISWKESALHIHNKIRALNLGPAAFTFFKKERLKIYRSQLVEMEFLSQISPGSILSSEKDHLTVACGKGALNLLEVQRAGKKRQLIEDFLRGVSVEKGDSFCNKTRNFQTR